MPKRKTNPPPSANDIDAARELWMRTASPFGPLPDPVTNAIHEEDISDSAMALLMLQGREHSKVRSLDKLSERRRVNLDEVLDNCAKEMRAPTRPLEELLERSVPV
ncbi:hypothetical protein QCA50_004204 [Cerrena zonata]|uniref:Uncharacterized protein n=1 Tax=Cerrena zonata TaxID=2478898 RepID=A0AAW0GST1_9APHY